MNNGFQELQRKVLYMRKQQVINKYWPVKVLGRSHVTKDTF